MALPIDASSEPESSSRAAQAGELECHWQALLPAFENVRKALLFGGRAHVSRAEHRPLDCRKRTVRAGSQYTSVEFDLFAVEFLGGKRVARSGQRTSQFPGCRTRIDSQHGHASTAARHALRVKR